MKPLWTFGKVKPIPKPSATPKTPTAPPKKGPDRVEAQRKAPRQGGSSPPKPAKPTKDVLRITPEEAADLLGLPPAFIKHPNTGQEIATRSPGRPPELFHKNGEVTGHPLWRYEGAEHWLNNRVSALHAWLAVFKPYFPKEAAMLCKQIAEEDSEGLLD